ncbi:MAG: pyrroloquinoline quinone biosynthesis protein PqqB [Polyangiaceae bacterium]
MRICVLGSAAGGGFPQWNCGCPNCRDVRLGSTVLRARTQDSLAFSTDGDSWFVVNASPDIHRQIQATPALAPRALRHSPIQAIVLTNGDLDHVLGLFSLRESLPLAIYATDAVRTGLVENPIFRTLERFEGQVVWRRLEVGRELPLTGTDGAPSGLTVEARAAKGKLPVHLEKGSKSASPEDNVGLWIREPSTKKSAVYLAATSSVAPFVSSLDADCVFVDGTFWSSDELPALGASKSRAEDMAHLPIGGDEGSLSKLSSIAARRKIYTHINNTNPILREDSIERGLVERAGWEVAFDGMEIDL